MNAADVDGLRERIARALRKWCMQAGEPDADDYGMADAVIAEIGDVERECKCETLHGSFTKHDGTTADTYVDRESCPIHRGDAERELARLREAARAAFEGPTDDELTAWKREAAQQGDGTTVFLATLVQNVRIRARDVLPLSGQQESETT